MKTTFPLEHYSYQNSKNLSIEQHIEHIDRNILKLTENNNLKNWPTFS